MKKLLWALLVVVIGIVIWLNNRPDPIDVWVSTVDKGAVESTVSNTRAGTIKACRRSKLSMPMGGVVDRLLVIEGQHVEAGQLLLELWNRDRKAEMMRAQASYNASEFEHKRACLLAERNLREAKRVRALAAKRLASEELVDNADSQAEIQQQACESASAQMDVARSQLELQQAVFERSQLKAPFAGVIAEINGEVGEYVTPSPPGVATPPAVDLIDYSCLYVTAPIDEVDASQVRVGQPARITLDAFRGVNLVGEVTRIAPYVLDIEKQARTVDVDVTITEVPADVGLLVGYSADITVILQRVDDVLRVPTESLLSGNKLWVLNADTSELEPRDVEVGIGNWTNTEVRAGVKAGEWVVRSPDKPEIAEGVVAVPRHD